MPTSLAGSRIREARRRAGVTQAALAAKAGISASYLNLIEHNRRRIGGRVLNAIAEALGTRPSELSEGGFPTMIADLQAAVAAHPGAPADADTAEALAGRFPGWADFLLQLERQTRDQHGIIMALSDRLTHDPFLSENVHAMLSHITAIRSTAGILSTVDNIPVPQQRRFHESLDAESVRLSETAQALANYLGAAARGRESAATAEEVLDHFLHRHGHRFDALDREAETAADLPEAVAAQRLADLVEDVMTAEAADLPATARSLIRAHLMAYARDARAMPLRAFAETGRETAWNPQALARAYRQEIIAVFRRLAVLRRPWIEVPAFGLIVVTASGYPLLRRPLSDFALPRHGNACTLWPLFQAFARPGILLMDRIEHDTGQPFVTLSHAAPRRPAALGETPDMAAAMLIVAERESPFEGPSHPAREVGTSCPICTRSDCPARAQPQLLS
ncbi:short-chain fatty acyl-CoA regulator family protein [Halovulum sp. GXIMD14794]